MQVLIFMFFFPDVVSTDALPLTGGLAAVALFGVLLIKLTGDPDHHLREFRLVTGLLGLGALLYFVPYLLGVQSNAIAIGPFVPISQFLVTNTNPTWAVMIGYVSVVLLAILGAIAVRYTWKTGGQAELEETHKSKEASAF
jgi:hypothetical protein